MIKKHKGQSAAFMRSINPHLKHHSRKKTYLKGGKMAKRKRGSKRKSSFGGGMWGTILGVGGFIVYESFISPMIPIGEPTKSIGELALGVILMRKGGIIGNIAKAAVVINTYQLMALYLKPAILGQPAAISY